MFDWLRPAGRGRRDGAPEEKASAARGLIAVQGAGRPVWTPRDYLSLATEGFGKNPVAYRCVRMIAEAAAAVPLRVFEDDAIVTAEHPLRRLLERPNPEQGGVDLLEALFGALQTAGNAYLEASGFEGFEGGAPSTTPSARPTSLDGGGSGLELYGLRPDRVKIVPGADGWPAAYEYAVDGRTVQLGARDADGWSGVLHLKLFHPADDHYGFAPLEAAAWAVDVHNASGAWNKALLDNAARPSGALIYGGAAGERMTAEQFESLKAELTAQHAGSANAGRPLILEGGLSWTAMSLSPGEMDFIAGKHAAAREIALAFGVPPQLLGIPGDATYANYREANTAFWRGTVVPLVEKTARALTGWLGAKFPGCGIAPDWDAVPALSAEREALWARLEAASFLTVEERRRMAGLGA
jgi:HK97 family phage portal protein